MRLVIELTEDEARAFERDAGSITQEVEAAEIRQGLLTEERRVRFIEAPKASFFADPVRTTRPKDLPTGPWLTVWLGGPKREETRGDHGAGGAPASG